MRGSTHELDDESESVPALSVSLRVEEGLVVVGGLVGLFSAGLGRESTIGMGNGYKRVKTCTHVVAVERVDVEVEVLVGGGFTIPLSVAGGVSSS